jgi:hypothetical protein
MPPKTPKATPSKSTTPRPDPPVPPLSQGLADTLTPQDVPTPPTILPRSSSTSQSAATPPTGTAIAGPTAQPPTTDLKADRKLAYPLPHISPTTINNTESLLRFVILGLISAAAIGSRLFAVIRFESVIHEL